MAIQRWRPSWRGAMAMVCLAGVAVTLPLLARRLERAFATRETAATAPPDVAAPPPAFDVRSSPGELDRQRIRWQQRLAAWREERDALLAGHEGPDSDREIELERRRALRFTERERSRVRVLDEIERSVSENVTPENQTSSSASSSSTR